MSTKPWLPVSLLAAAVAGGAWWWSRPPATPVGDAASTAAAPASGAASGNAPRLQTVGVFPAKQQDVPVQIEASGTVTPLRSVDIRAQITGTVLEAPIRDGQDVKAGQLLFRFDDRAERANLEKARAQLARDRATLADQERQLARAQELRAQNFIAQSAVDTVMSQVEAQKALIVSDLAAIKASEVTLSYSTVRAPMNGRIGLVNASAGSLVQPAATATPLVTISQIDPVGVTFTVPEAQLGALQAAAGGRPRPAAGAASGASAGASAPARPASAPAIAASGVGAAGAASAARAASGAGAGGGGLRAYASLPGGPRNAADAPPPIEGRVTFIDNAVDTTSGTIRVRAEFPNADRQLWPGQYVRIKLTLRTVKDAVVIPQAALIIRGQERSVYVVGDDNIAQLRPVQTRQPLGELIVVEGVQAGEKVVLDGKQNLRPNNPVKAVPAQLDPAARRPKGAADAASGAASGVAPGASGVVSDASASASGHAGGNAGGAAASGARP